ncbi:helix-turn-helix domain-containing protein [Curtobacterium sp. B18]|uniref:helix-turn-helix domain-containing protein n=1 Tax=Curtobacterium sp. B18 TaxID=95614 RepID=UPI0003B3D6A4|nr:helix-turn-helix transcriptional regulator [Curtobacterium sp. B18]
MQSQSTPSLSDAIRSARLEKGMSTYELGSQVGVNQSNIVRIESGHIAAPNPALLSAIAEVLGLDVADVYALAGYTRPSQLPTFTPYLRSKFADMPAEARAELEQSFRLLADKYGFDADGPASGEDEN